MDKEMAFLEPVLASCANRSQIAKEHPLLGSPQAWLSNAFLLQFNLVGVSFDYFIDWSTGALDRELWLKCPLNARIIRDWYTASDASICDLLRGHSRFRDLVNFAANSNCTAAAIIFDDDQNWNSDVAPVLLARWPADNRSGFGLEIKRSTLGEVKNLIRKKSGGPISIGSKGLIYGTSRLECHLSRTDALWPGDADLLICDRSSKRPVVLLEFKKHTDRARIGFQDQRLSNYYPNPDRRKYDRLMLLAKQIAPNGVRVFNIYYSTVESDASLKLEEVVVDANSLVGVNEAFINLQAEDLLEGYVDLVHRIT